MPLLSNKPTSILAAAASEMLQACPDVIDVERATLTIGNAGGTSYDWSSPTIVACKVPCNIQSARPMESEQFARRGIKVSHKIFIPQGIAIQQGDRIPNPQDATQFFIVTFIGNMGGQSVAYRLFVNLVV